MKHILIALSLATLAACTGPAPAPAAAPAPAPETAPAPAPTAGLQVTDAWSRATPPNAQVGGGYLTITNAGSAGDRLVRVETAAAQRVEIHEMSHEDGVMRMRELVDGLPLAAGQATELKPGGYHLMFIEPAQPFVAGQSIPATLVFEKAGAQPVIFEVRALDADAGAAKHH